MFARTFEGLAAEAADQKTIRFEATYLKAHRTASSMCGKKGGGRLIGWAKGGMNTKLHAITDTNGRPIRFFMTAGQVSDYTGAAALLGGLPRAEHWMLSGRLSLTPHLACRGRTVRTRRHRCRSPAEAPGGRGGDDRSNRVMEYG